MIDAAGFQFVVSIPAQTRDEHDRKAIRSHATRAGAPRRRPIKLPHPWICPDRNLGPLKEVLSEEASTSQSILPLPVPRSVGAYFLGLQLPPGIEPYMIQDLVKLIDLDKHGVYPYEICLNVHVVERGWFPYMISDICCLHSMLFSVRAFVERPLHSQLSRLASSHYAKTLQLLQARLNDPDRTSAISDATIMVVITLAATAELTGDFAAVITHIEGLEKIVSLRGGLPALNTHNIQVKACRADLAYALLFGRRPLLFKEAIPWDCFIGDRGLIKCSHYPHDANICAFVETILDTRLRNALRDLHAFSCISNLAYQTTRKLSPETYNEMSISILYRLTYLCFERDPLQEVIRVGLLAISSTIFMQRYFLGKPYNHLLNLYSNALLRLLESIDVDLPVPILLWLMMLSHVVIDKEPSPTDWRSLWLDKAILRAGINSWPQAQEILRSIVKPIKTPFLRPLIDEIEKTSDRLTIVLKYLEDHLLIASNQKTLTRNELRTLPKRYSKLWNVKLDNVPVNYEKADIRFSDAQLSDMGGIYPVTLKYAKEG
ncbi:hypothetical protein B7494_g7953 [Chlorociboria aeruginascens]|nr:hypothetical protein B7494_g7953 [Chlorociboria aeruginascens]